MLFIGISSIAEEITLTTYYPAPYGAYEELDVGILNVTEELNFDDLEIGEVDFSSLVVGRTYIDEEEEAPENGMIVEGRVGIGTPNPSNVLSIATWYEPEIQPDFRNKGLEIYNYCLPIGVGMENEEGLGGNIYLGRSRHNTVGEHGFLNDGERIGTICFQGSDGEVFKTGASIRAIAAEQFSEEHCGTRLQFHTVEVLTTQLRERMCIDHHGDIGIGIEPEGGVRLHVRGATDGEEDATVALYVDNSASRQLLRIRNSGDITFGGVQLDPVRVFIYGDVRAASYSVIGGAQGVSGSFRTADDQTVTVTNGIITSIEED